MLNNNANVDNTTNVNAGFGKENNMMSVKEGIELMINNYDVAKENLAVRLENMDNVNPEDPHVKVADLAITYRLKIDDETVVKVNKAMVDNWKAGGYEVNLPHDALESASKKEPVMIQSLPGVIAGAFGITDIDDDGMTVIVTTESMVGGAAALFYKGVRETLMEKFGTRDLLIIPSSVHEVLITRYGDFNRLFVSLCG